LIYIAKFVSGFEALVQCYP